MDQQKIQSFQDKFLEFQQNLIETVSSENDEIKVTVNGRMEITDLKMNASQPATELEA
ncbi:MAG: hypothetical protein H7Z13_01525, partial [Ferruginibacter sp.]|nr:hypothetical protein [Ferruginibacter sp.]